MTVLSSRIRVVKPWWATPLLRATAFSLSVVSDWGAPVPAAWLDAIHEWAAARIARHVRVDFGP